MATLTATYTATSWAFMDRAANALTAGDLLRASRQGWCATAVMLRGIAQARGWRYTDFYGLDGVMNRLAAEYDDAEDLDLGFDAAIALEMNAYEDTESRLGVEICLADIAKLLRQLERLPA